MQVILESQEKGWFLNPFNITLFNRFLCDKNVSKPNDEHFLIFFEDDWQSDWTRILNDFPNRKVLLTEAKICFEQELYGAAIHLFISQIDGIFLDTFGCGFFKHGTELANDEIKIKFEEQFNLDSLDQLSSQLKNNFVTHTYGPHLAEVFNGLKANDAIRSNDPAKVSEDDFSIINRHGVIHGYLSDYSTKIAAMKWYTLLDLIRYAVDLKRKQK